MTQRRRRTAVAILDDGRQATLFDPFAASLRRRGLRTARLTLRRPSLARMLRDRIFYSEVLRLRPDHAAEALRRLFSRYRIVDVQLGEATLAGLGVSSSLALALAEGALSCAGTQPSTLFDKFELNERLGGAGVLVPRQISANTTSAVCAAARLGLPLVVKRRVAEGGRGVHIAATPAEAEAVLARWGAREDAFFQQHVCGDLVMYGVVIGETGPLVERCFRATELQRPCGPSGRIVMYDDPDLARTGREIAAIIGLRGLGQFDFVRDPAGRLWHIDANARCWGSMLAANAHAAGFLSAYTRLLAGGLPAAGPAETTEEEVGIQPHALLSAAATGSWRSLAAEWRDFARFCRSGPGPGYGALIAIKAAAVLALRRTRRERVSLAG